MSICQPPEWAVRTKADRLALEQGYVWDEAKAAAILTFAHAVFKPQYIAGDFQLLPWQARFLQSLVAWRKPDGTRRWKTANLHIAKKNGKTLLVSILCLFEFFCSTPSPFIASGSVTKENAGQVFSELRNSVRGLKAVKVTPNQRRMTLPKTNAEYRALSSDGDSAQGYNLSLAVVDEAHAHKNNSLYDSLRYATIARPDGLLIVISTAGDDVTHWYHGVYTKSKNVLSGTDDDLTHYAEVYESDPERFDADPDDIDQWKKANPSLGVAFSEADFRNQLRAARTSTAEWLSWKRYRQNIWCRPDELAWLDVGLHWDKNRKVISDDELKKYPALLGIDLSQTVDPSSVSLVFVLPDRRFHVRSWAWVAAEGVKQREKSNLPKYAQFAFSLSWRLSRSRFSTISTLPGAMRPERTISRNPPIAAAGFRCAPWYPDLPLSTSDNDPSSDHPCFSHSLSASFWRSSPSPFAWL